MTTLHKFNKNWSYKTDKEKFGVEEYWEEPVPDKDGKYESDCESYAIFVKRNILDYQNWKYCYCKLNGEGHCVLINEFSNLVIDNNVQTPIDLKDYKIGMARRGVLITELRLYSWYELLWKFGSTKVIKLWLKLKRKS